MSIETSLRDVSDTALGVAMERARATERPRPLVCDPYARMLAGERGTRISRDMRCGLISSAIVVRAAVFDELILRTIERGGAECVLNLGAGLDARPYRLDLPPDLRWVEVDLPGMIDYKTRLLADERPRCRLERVAVDLADGDARRALLERVAGGRPTIVVSEGVLFYLEPDAVAALGRELAARDDYRWWLLDLANPLFVEWGNLLIGRHLEAAGAPYRFAPAEGVAFFRPLGWEPLDDRSSWEEARRLGREPWIMRVAWTLATPSRRRTYRDVSRYVLMGRRQEARPPARPGRG